RYWDNQSRRQIDQVTGKAIDMKTHDAADVLAQIVAALATGRAFPASHGAIHHHLIASLESADPVADRSYFARGFGADYQRQLPFRECHAAKTPKVEVVEGDHLDSNLHFVLAGWRGRG